MSSSGGQKGGGPGSRSRGRGRRRGCRTGRGAHGRAPPSSLLRSRRHGGPPPAGRAADAMPRRWWSASRCSASNSATDQGPSGTTGRPTRAGAHDGSPARDTRTAPCSASTGPVVRDRPVGSVHVARPSAARCTRQPARCFVRWWRRQRVRRLSAEVGPAGHGRTWSRSQNRAATWHPGKRHRPSRARTCAASRAPGRYAALVSVPSGSSRPPVAGLATTRDTIPAAATPVAAHGARPYRLGGPAPLHEDVLPGPEPDDLDEVVGMSGVRPRRSSRHRAVHRVTRCLRLDGRRGHEADDGVDRRAALDEVGQRLRAGPPDALADPLGDVAPGQGVDGCPRAGRLLRREGAVPGVDAGLAGPPLQPRLRPGTPRPLPQEVGAHPGQHPAAPPSQRGRVIAAEVRVERRDDRGGNLRGGRLELVGDDRGPVGVEPARRHGPVEPREAGRRRGSGGPVGRQPHGGPDPPLGVHGRDGQRPGDECRGVERDVARRPVQLEDRAVLGPLRLDGREPGDRGVLDRGEGSRDAAQPDQRVHPLTTGACGGTRRDDPGERLGGLPGRVHDVHRTDHGFPLPLRSILPPGRQSHKRSIGSVHRGRRRQPGETVVAHRGPDAFGMHCGHGR
jgi:hypothetical protein